MRFKDNPIVFLYRKTWEYSKGNRFNVVAYTLMFIVANFFAFLHPLLLAKILNTIQLDGVNPNNIGMILALLFGFIVLSILFWMFHGPARVIERKNSFLVNANYKNYLMNGIMRLPSQWHVDHHSGDTIDKVEKSTRAMWTFSSHTFEIIETTVMLFMSYFAMVYFNIHSTYIIAFVVIIAITTILKFDNKLRKEYKILFLAQNNVSAKIYDVISNISTVIILRIEKIMSKEIYKKIMHPFGIWSKAAKTNEIKWFWVAMFNSLMYFLIIASYVLSSYIAGEAVMVGTISALFAYVKRINNVFTRFAYKYGEMVLQKVSVENVQPIEKLFEDKVKIKQVSMKKKWKKWKIKDLNFSYHGKDSGDLHLKDVNLEFNKGEKIALVGESGGGKTTFLKMLRGLHEPKYIELYLDHKFLNKGIDSISDNIALIPQEPEIFNTTVKENITLGIPHNLKFIKKFTDMAQFTSVVKRLPNKLNSSIVEKGVNLSGGEKQRLALTRGLMASINKPVLLLDESTSSVDVKNESKIYRNIFNSFRNKTIIATIHKLNLLHYFDRIYLFKKGRIVANGTLKDLKKDSKDFKVLWDKYHKSLK
jgi:ABC-type multidrug transport system fused ATPase/permease subunit